MLFAKSQTPGYGDGTVFVALMAAKPQASRSENPSREVNETYAPTGDLWITLDGAMRVETPAVAQIRAKLLQLKTFSNADLSTLLNDGHGCALLANYVNFCAKEICTSFYDIKPALIERAISLMSPSDWFCDGDIAYLQTPMGQVSFHYPGNVPCTPTFLRWEGNYLQPIAEELCEKFLRLFA